MESTELFINSKLFWFTSLLFLVYLYLKFVVYNVWRRQKIPHDKPTIPLGNIPVSYLFGKMPHGTIIKNSYDKYKKHRFHGVYMLCEPVLVINNPDLIQQVLVKNFNTFYNRGSLNNEGKDPLTTSLIRLYDEKWKRLREKLSPTFTSGKLKLMYPLIKEISDGMVKVYEDALRETDVIDVKDLSTRYTIDCIASIAFGFNCDSLRNPDSDFLKYGKISNFIGRNFIILSFYIPQLSLFYPIPKERKDVGKFFANLFREMVGYRRENKTVRNDFMQLLMQLMDDGKVQEDNERRPTQPHAKTKITESDKITMVEAIGQAMFFFAAGHETSASAIICCLYELALNQDIQEKLRDEIIEVSNSPGGLSYEKLFEMTYLDMVFHEALRKHPAASILNRICVKDFHVPDSDFVIKKGTRVVIPIQALHLDPQFYPEPEMFDPMRFTTENKMKRHPFTFLAFGEGPRHCIGKRLGLLKPKIALFNLILNYKFSVHEKTPIPLKYMTDYFLLVPEGQIYLKTERITQL